MEIQKELQAFRTVAIRKGWDMDGETTSSNFNFYSLQTRSAWESWQAAKDQTVPEGFVLVRKEDFESLGEFKDLYKRAIISAKKRKNQINWAHVAGLGVGSGRAVDLCKSLGIDPGATNMHVVIEAQEQTNESI
jgi:hypothetical protein